MKVKSIFPRMLVVIAAFAIGSVSGRRTMGEISSSTQNELSTTASLGQTGILPHETLQPVYRATPRNQTTQQTIVARPLINVGETTIVPTVSAPEGWLLVENLNKQTVPWSAATQKMYDQNKGMLSQEQAEMLFANYNNKKNSLAQAQADQEQMQQRPAIGVETPWTFQSAALGLKARAAALSSQAWSKSAEALKNVQGTGSRYLDKVTGGFGYSIGTGWKIAAAVGAAAMAPYLGAAAAAVGLVSGTGVAISGLGAGVGAFLLTNVADKVEFMYQHEGKMSENEVIEQLKLALEIVLQNAAAYPTIKTKIQALQDMKELRSFHKDTYGFMAKAHESLRNDYNKVFEQMSSDQKKKEHLFSATVAQMRKGYGYDPSNPEALNNYAKQLIPDDKLLSYQAYLSEYYRALNRQAILEETAAAKAEEAKKAKEVVQAVK